MKDQDRQELVPVEQQLNIQFIEPSNRMLIGLEKQLERLAQYLNSQIYRPALPEKGFLSTPLTPDQEKIILQLIGPSYAHAAVELQEKLTDITVSENNEKMVFLPSVLQNEKLNFSLSKLPFHEACGEWAGKPRVFWIRDQMALRIIKAAHALETIGITLHFEDAFRPVGVQEGLFSRRIKMILQEHPEWIEDWDKVWNEARSKTAISPWMAGHKSGAAVDITLRDQNGIPLPLGNKYPDGGPKVALHYPYVTQEEWSTRQLFVMAMEMSGLRTYPYENWHASFGDLSAGIAQFSSSEATPNYQTIYGPIKGFDPKTGEIEPYNIDEYFAPFFTKEQCIQMFAQR